MIEPRKVKVGDVEYVIRVTTKAHGYKATAYKEGRRADIATFYADYETAEDFEHQTGSVVELLFYCVTKELEQMA